MAEQVPEEAAARLKATPAELPELTEAVGEDLGLAVGAIGPLARYGGLLRAALAGIYAERERIAKLAEDRDATYDVAAPCGCGRLLCTASVREPQSFADLIMGKP